MADKELKSLRFSGLSDRYIIDALSSEAKEALLACFQHVVWTDEHGQDYYDALYEALYDTKWQITQTLTNCTTSNAATEVLKGGSFSATISPAVGYVMEGATVSITMGGVDVTASVYSNGVIAIPAVTGALVITISAAAQSVSSISAVFTQGDNVIYTNDDLDTLKQYLVVTATYTDSSTATIPAADYTLTGTLAEGTQTITVGYGGLTATFTVSCTVKGYLYHFQQSLASSGSEDFGFSGSNVAYSERTSGNYAYYRAIDTTADPSATVGTGIKALNLQTVPDFSGDFTISGWAKGSDNGFNLMTAYKAPSSSTTNVPTANSTVDNLASGWTVGENSNVSAGYKGVRVQTISGLVNIQLFASDENKRVWIKLTPPSGFSFEDWHHYALTRKSGRIYFFIDGAIICTVDYDHPIYFADQVAVCGAFKTYSDRNNIAINSMDYWADDLFIADYCKWDSAFDAAAITY